MRLEQMTEEQRERHKEKQRAERARRQKFYEAARDARYVLGHPDWTTARIRHQKPKLPSGTFTVRCGGDLHRVTVTARGPIRFHDHRRADMLTMMTAAAIGGFDAAAQFGCLRVKRETIRRVAGRPEMKPAIVVAGRLHQSRRYRQSRAERDDPFSERQRRMRTDDLVSTVRRAALEAWYLWEARPMVPVELHVVNRRDRNPPRDIMPGVYVTASELNVVTSITYQLSPSWTWLHSRGLAIVDDAFALGIIGDRHAHEPLVLFARRSRFNGRVVPWTGRVRLDGPAPRVEWIGPGREP